LFETCTVTLAIFSLSTRTLAHELVKDATLPLAGGRTFCDKRLVHSGPQIFIAIFFFFIDVIHVLLIFAPFDLRNGKRGGQFIWKYFRQ